MKKQKQSEKLPLRTSRRGFKPLGGSWMTIVCAALPLLSAWEFCVRLDAMYKPLKMFFDLAVGEGIPLERAMNYFDWSILEPPLWLLACGLTGIIALFLSRRPLGSLLFTPLCALLAAYGLNRQGTLFVDLWQLVHPALLIILATFGLINLLSYPLRRKHFLRSVSPDAPAPRLGDAPRLSRVSRTTANAPDPIEKQQSDRIA